MTPSTTLCPAYLFFRLQLFASVRIAYERLREDFGGEQRLKTAPAAWLTEALLARAPCVGRRP